MDKKLYVGNLPYTITEADLLTLFSKAGRVTAIQLIKDRAIGRSKGFAFVEMSTEAEAEMAIILFNGKDFNGRLLTVTKAKPRENSSFRQVIFNSMSSRDQRDNSDTKPNTDKQRLLRVFLCYAHSDAVSVRELYDRLTSDNVDAWLDKEKILPGQDWELEIRKAVQESDAILVCLSRQFNRSGFRQKEVRFALDTAMKQPEGEIFIIPARLEECNTLESLRKWNWVNLFEKDGYEKLMRSLKVRAQKVGTVL
jgi:RNA recognition motif-containing protein